MSLNLARSFLFALQHIIREEWCGKNPSRAPSGAYWHWKQNTQLCVLDTYKIGAESTFSAPQLLSKIHVPNLREMQLKLYSAAYLTCGELTVSRCSSTVFPRHLIDSGLFDVVPQLQDFKNSWYLRSRLSELRSPSFDDPKLISRSDMNVAFLPATKFWQRLDIYHSLCAPWFSTVSPEVYPLFGGCYSLLTYSRDAFICGIDERRPR